MIILRLLQLVVVLGGCVYGLFLVAKGVWCLFTKRLVSGLQYIVIGLPLSMLLVIGAIAPPFVSHILDLRLVICRVNMRQFGDAIQHYSVDHEGMRPATFAQVINYFERGSVIHHVTYDDDHEETQMLNPLQVCLDYVLVTNVSAQSEPHDVQAYCVPAHHNGSCCNVLFVNGDVTSIRKEHFCDLSCDVEKLSRINTRKNHLVERRLP